VGNVVDEIIEKVSFKIQFAAAAAAAAVFFFNESSHKNKF
jgi:hypothetical protein